MQQRCAHPIQTGGGGGRREIQLCTRCRTESLQTSLLSMPPLTLMAVFSVAAFTQNRLRHRDRRQWQQNCAAVPSDYTAIKCGNVCVCVSRLGWSLRCSVRRIIYVHLSRPEKCRTHACTVSQFQISHRNRKRFILCKSLSGGQRVSRVFGCTDQVLGGTCQNKQYKRCDCHRCIKPRIDGNCLAPNTIVKLIVRMTDLSVFR